MAREIGTQAIAEVLDWLEQQVREAREDQFRGTQHIEQLRRQLQEIATEVREAERTVREVEPRFLPLKGVPEKLREIEEGAEHTRQAIASNRQEIDQALRLLSAEASYDREERSEVIRRVDAIGSQVTNVLADVAQVQNQTAQMSQTLQVIAERQREIEQKVEQFGLRLERAIEVNRDLEQRVRETVMSDVEERLDVVFERLQVVGEMVKRNEALIDEATREQTMRQEVMQEISIWRDGQQRLEGRLVVVEERAERVFGEIDKLQGEITLLEGRHSGLGERVAGIRREVSEVLDAVRAEFAKFNQLTEKQRRKQIQVLEQELREMKFHAFRPPEEP